MKLKVEPSRLCVGVFTYVCWLFLCINTLNLPSLYRSLDGAIVKVWSCSSKLRDPRKLHSDVLSKDQNCLLNYVGKYKRKSSESSFSHTHTFIFLVLVQVLLLISVQKSKEVSWNFHRLLCFFCFIIENDLISFTWLDLTWLDCTWLYRYSCKRRSTPSSWTTENIHPENGPAKVQIQEKNLWQHLKTFCKEQGLKMWKHGRDKRLIAVIVVKAVSGGVVVLLA